MSSAQKVARMKTTAISPDTSPRIRKAGSST
jgi:hypothetical protein